MFLQASCSLLDAQKKDFSSSSESQLSSKSDSSEALGDGNVNIIGESDAMLLSRFFLCQRRRERK